MRTITAIIAVLALLCSCKNQSIKIYSSYCNLQGNKLANSWDEAIPLGNGMLGGLVWQKGKKLRISLDRADLWDLRPMPNLNSPDWRYSWVVEQWKRNNYKIVQNEFDKPYDELPAPSKIPAGALEFDISSLGEIEAVTLDIRNALCEIRWKNGARFLTFIHASHQTGWYRFEGIPDEIRPYLVPPAYNSGGDRKVVEMSFFDLDRLGYEQGKISEFPGSITYDQEGWGGFRYQIGTEWKNGRGSSEGCWSISSEYPGWPVQIKAAENVKESLKEGFERSYEVHSGWWRDFWKRSSISVPDSVLQKQWELEMYKFGSAARADAPPISLQAVWTADNGKLPPWKGDFHNDLNTQLSYWPAYSSNHLDLEEGFINWLFANRETFRHYTKVYFGKNGLNVPGVATLTGEPMGGWIQYSFGPTVSAWLSQNFYLHWRYTMDRQFLETKAYPWIKDVAEFLDELSVRGADGRRKLPASSSPEIFDNSSKAWFGEISNFDLALIRWTFSKASELAGELSLSEDKSRWEKILSEWPQFTIDSKTGLMFAPDVPYEQSHRHFSHLMAIHPLGLIDYSQDDSARKVIDSTISNLEAVGPDWWCGYSYSWLGNLYARSFRGDKAAETLRIFAECFCLPNSFHVNGDQTKSGKSKFTYRPFTLEGNFAFASGVQEMLIQSHTGTVRIFPAVPAEWENISFENLRTEGAFLISAEMRGGNVISVKITSCRESTLRLQSPFPKSVKSNIPFSMENGIIILKMTNGQEAELVPE
jgi:alpha-L-fucosidase 2